MEKKKKFKKGDKVYIINDRYNHPNPAIVECEIEKIITEDRLKSWSNKEVYRKKKHYDIIGLVAKLAWVKYKNAYGRLIEEWVAVDILKHNSSDFKEFIN